MAFRFIPNTLMICAASFCTTPSFAETLLAEKNSSNNTLIFTLLLIIIILLASSLIFYMLKTKSLKKNVPTNDIYKKVFDNVSASLEYYDKDGILIEINEPALSLYGMSSKENILDAKICLYDNPYYQAQNKQNKLQPKVFNCDYNFDDLKRSKYYKTNKSGKIRIENKLTPIVNKLGQLEGTVIVSSDITEEHQYLSEIRDVHNHLNLALEAGNVAAWIFDIEKQIFFTLAGQAIAGTGITMEQNLSILHPDDVSYQEELFRCISSGEKSRCHGIFRYKSAPSSDEYRYFDSHMIVNKQNGEIKYITGTQKDITEEYFYQSILEENKLKTELAVKTSDIVQWDYDSTNKKFSTINHILKLKSLNFSEDNSHPEDLSTISDFMNLMNSGRDEQFSVDIKLKYNESEEWQHVTMTGVPLKKDRNGCVTNYTGFIRNNTKWYNMTNELHRINTQNKLMLNNINSGLVYLTPDFKVVWENVSEMININTNKHKFYEVGKLCHESAIGSSSPCPNCIMCKTLKSRKTEHSEMTLPNGKVIEVMGNPVINEDGSIEGVMLRFDDISTRKKIYNELEEAKSKALYSNKLLSTILDQMPVAVIIKDVTDDFRYIVANRVFCHLSGKQESEIIGKTDYEIFTPQEADNFRRDDQNTMLEERIQFMEETFWNGKDIIWQTTKWKFETSDNRFLLIGICVDVTEITQTNNELRKAKEKAEQSDKLKSAFLANMSHEIRTPLNSIVGFSDLLQNTDDSERKAEYWNIISENNELLLTLISDILDLSKIEAGYIELNNIRFNLTEYFNDIVKAFKPKMPKGVELRYETPDSFSYIEFDKNRLAQIITNFLNNAIKFTTEGYIKIGYEIVDNGAKIYCTDTGIGISKESQEKVFGRFEKLNDFAQGTGLGLSICKAIVDIKGGDIGVDSEVGKGSTFWAFLPCSVETKETSDSQGKVTSNVKPDVKDTNDIRILVAEDNDSNYILIKSILKNFSLIRATNGVEAIEIVKKNNINLILMDIKMPVMNGLEATSEIRKFNAEIPIIAVTANAFDSDYIKAQEAGCDNFLAKPLKINLLLDMIEKYIH